MKVQEIDEKIAELQRLRADAEAKERTARQEENFEEAQKLLGDLVPMLQRLFDLEYLPPRLETALTDSQGKFNPGMYIKRRPARK